MATMTKRTLSGSDDGRGIKVTTASPIDGSDTTIHTAVSGTVDTDLVTLYAYCDDAAAVALHLAWGGTTLPDDSIIQTIPSKSGLVLVTVALPLRDSQVIVASAATVNKIVIFGHVDRITV